MLGVAVDPNFASNSFIYIYYTFKNTGTCPIRLGDEPGQPRQPLHARHADNATPSIPRAELVLVDNIPSTAGNHNAGDVQFGKDGNLYISVGDGGCDYLTPTSCAGSNDAARDQNVLLGKILRITPSGGDPGDNPYASPRRPTARAATSPAARRRGTLPGDLRLGPAQPVPDGVRPERRRHALLHQRRRPERLGGDRPRRRRRRLRLERARGPLRQRLDDELRRPAGRHDEPDLRLRPQRRLRLDHRRRVRAQRRLAGAVRRHVPVRRLRLRADLPARARRARRLHALDVRRRARRQQRGAHDVRPVRRHAGAVLHELPVGRHDPPHLVQRRQQPADRGPDGEPDLGPARRRRDARRLGQQRSRPRRHADVPVGLRRRLADDADLVVDDDAHLRVRRQLHREPDGARRQGRDLVAGDGAHRRRQHRRRCRSSRRPPPASASPSAR